MNTRKRTMTFNLDEAEADIFALVGGGCPKCGNELMANIGNPIIVIHCTVCEYVEIRGEED